MLGWAYLALIIGGGSASNIIVWNKKPELLRRRSRFREGTKAWSKAIRTIFATTTVMVMPVGALDTGRCHWSHMPIWLRSVGATLYIAGQVIVTWAARQSIFREDGPHSD